MRKTQRKKWRTRFDNLILDEEEAGHLREELLEQLDIGLILEVTV